MSHRCHWPKCAREVPPAMWGCRPHWFALPEFLRDLVWEAYVPGQESRKDPSKRYLQVAGLVQMWIEAAYAPLIRTEKEGVLRPLNREERLKMTKAFRKTLEDEDFF